MTEHISYSTHKLSNLVSVEELVTADYLRGSHMARFTHSHSNAWELVFCMKHRMKAFVNDNPKELQQGDSFFIRPGVMHDILVDSDNTQAFIISFTCSNPDLLMPLEDRVIVTGEEEQRLFRKIREELETAYIRNPGNLHLLSFEPSDSSPLGAEQMICCCLEQLIILMLRDITKKGDVIPKTSDIRNIMQDCLIERVNEYIAAHYGEHLSVGRIASQFHYSRTRFSTLYKELTGKGVNETISDMRLNTARELLLRGGLSIGEVASRSGFTSLQYFSRKFSERIGMSPSEFISKNFKENTKNESES